MDYEFNQLDLVQVQIAAKYLNGQPADWGEGDWDGAPGGTAGSPPQGNGFFDQLDIIAALAAGTYLTGPYAAVADDGQAGDAQTSVGYNPGTGEVFVDAPAGNELTSINIDSAAGIFTGSPLPEVTLEQWQRLLDINLTGVFLCNQAVVISISVGGAIFVGANFREFFFFRADIVYYARI